MTREESAKWAALLQAQADGKQIQYQYADLTWHDVTITDISGILTRWRIAPDLPPKPSQEWLDYANNWNCDIIEWSYSPPAGALCGSMLSGFGSPSGIPALRAEPFFCEAQLNGSTDGRWILRRRAPVVKPWTIDTVPMPLVVIHKQAGRLAVCVSADKDGVWLISNTLGGVIIVTYANLIRDFTQRDGSPCGEVAK